MGKGGGFGSKEDVLKGRGRQQRVSGAVWACPCCSRGGEGWAAGLAGRAGGSFRLGGTWGSSGQPEPEQSPVVCRHPSWDKPCDGGSIWLILWHQHLKFRWRLLSSVCRDGTSPPEIPTPSPSPASAAVWFVSFCPWSPYVKPNFAFPRAVFLF